MVYPLSKTNSISSGYVGRRDGYGRRLAVAAWILLAGFALTSCASHSLQAQSEHNQPLVDEANLLSGIAVFGAPVAPLTNLPPRLLERHPEMPDFVAAAVSHKPLSVARLKLVLKALSEQNYFVGSYAADATQTASDSFANKRGNCLSYTAMFVVLARMADLEVSFQVVDVPPAWTAGTDYLVRSTHINAVVHGVRMSRPARHDLTVDFNSVASTSRYKTKIISDAYANSLFLANLGVQQLQAGNNLAGFRYLRASIQLEPTNTDLWVNLAAFYATHQAPQQAQAAYLKALNLDPGSRAVHAGLARAYDKLAQPKLAQYHQELARRYQAKNPYYHFSVAQRALQQANYLYALEAINRALQLHAADGSFHYLKAFTLNGLGDATGAAQSLRKAKRMGADPLVQRRYPLPLDSALNISDALSMAN